MAGHWELIVKPDNIKLNDSDLNHISDSIREGITSGEIKQEEKHDKQIEYEIFEGEYIGSWRLAPGVGARVLRFKLDNGDIKKVRLLSFILYEEILDETGMKIGDRVRVKANDTITIKILNKK